MSIVLGGVTDAFTGGLSLLGTSIASGAFGVGGGIIETAPGVASILPKVQYEFFHSHNYLAEIREGPHQSQFFPHSIWQYLTQTHEADLSLRDQLLEKWNERREIEDTSRAEEARRRELLLSEGGFYGVADLRARGAMLQPLAASIDLMHDDLEAPIRDLLVREPELVM